MKSYTPIIFIAVAIGIFFVVIDPQYKEVQELLEEKKANDALIVRANELRRQRQDLTNRYNSISGEQRDRLNRLLPETVDNVRLILDIDNIARRSGILLRGISVSGDINQSEEAVSRVIDRTGRNYGTIQLSFSFSANYSTMKRFMREMENSLRMVDIKEFSVTAPEEGDIYSYSLTLDTYWLR